MTLTYTQAIDEMYGMFLTAWNADASNYTTGAYTPEVRYEGVENPNELDYSKHWCRLSDRPVIDTQASFRNGDQGQCYDVEGLLFIQLFAPKSDSQAWRQCEQLAELVKNTFRGHSTSGKVWFRNTRIQKLNPENDWYRINVVSEYRFFEQRT